MVFSFSSYGRGLLVASFYSQRPGTNTMQDVDYGASAHLWTTMGSQGRAQRGLTDLNTHCSSRGLWVVGWRTRERERAKPFAIKELKTPAS